MSNFNSFTRRRILIRGRGGRGGGGDLNKSAKKGDAVNLTKLGIVRASMLHELMKALFLFPLHLLRLNRLKKTRARGEGKGNEFC